MLRDYQVTGFDDIRAAFREGHRRVCYVLPTGGGKTTVAAAMIQGAVERGRKVLFFAHRKELIDQASARLDTFGIAHGVIMANHWRSRPWESVQVASIQTLSRRGMPWEPDFIVCDEAHRIKGASYVAFLAQFPRAYVIGITATPVRGDGKGLSPPFEKLVIGPSVRMLTDQGYLVPAVCWSKKSPDIKGVKTTGGDYNLGQLEIAMNRSEITGDVVQTWLKRARGRQTVVFAVGVEHSKAIAAAFRAAGEAAEHLYGETSIADREAILARLASGETRIVTNCGVLSEGWDCPIVSCISIVRPTQSLTLYLQMAGRALRPADGKTDCIILDHGGCIRLPGFGLPDSDREWTLEGDETRKKGPKTKDIDDTVRICPDCDLVCELNAAVCPSCGYEFFRREREIKQVDGELEIVTAAEIVPLAVKQRDYEWFLVQQHTRLKASGEPYSEGYAFAKYMAKYGERPKRGWKQTWQDMHPDIVRADRARRALTMARAS